MHHGVLGYEAMGLNRTFHNPPFGVFSYEATRHEGYVFDRLHDLRHGEVQAEHAPLIRKGGGGKVLFEEARVAS